MRLREFRFGRNAEAYYFVIITFNFIINCVYNKNKCVRSLPDEFSQVGIIAGKNSHSYSEKRLEVSDVKLYFNKLLKSFRNFKL